ncbi:hypothetical protein N6H18_08510 [Reichenbachiella agarivorans]|uniref:Uncharacterized protein n=1 Tax=Reichenbachiella agarivorans TaxID=2979464 RepID=A0ABY6CTZ5_9BACT|nr:hypothetical protein [Reichenbachiella agarivorans]UXP33986.1 hypothetical protein N6H18_08510 [Reichenbachiella agarivorans]
MSNKQTYEDAVIFVMDSQDEPFFLDSEGNRSDPNNPEAFTTLVDGNGDGEIRWFAGAGVKKITEIKIVSGDIVYDLQSKRKGTYWKAKIKACLEGESKYDVTFVNYNGETITIDPQMKVTPPPTE